MEVAPAVEVHAMARHELMNRDQVVLARLGFFMMVFSTANILCALGEQQSMNLFVNYVLLVIGTGFVLLSALVQVAPGVARPAAMVAFALCRFVASLLDAIYGGLLL